MKLEIKYEGQYEKPEYGSKGAAGFDMRNNLAQSIELAPGEAFIFPTGVSCAIPEGYVGLVHVRSSLGFKRGCILANGTGVIDSDYRGEINAKIRNPSNKTVKIDAGERIIQMLIQPVVQCDLTFVDELNETERGEGGYGSTGKF